eukprot:3098630-Pyramimonas_sp.AAC.1
MNVDKGGDNIFSVRTSVCRVRPFKTMMIAVCWCFLRQCQLIFEKLLEVFDSWCREVRDGLVVDFAPLPWAWSASQFEGYFSGRWRRRRGDYT